MRYHCNYHLARQEMLPWLDIFFKKIIVFGYFKFHGKQDAVNAILENND